MKPPAISAIDAILEAASSENRRTSEGEKCKTRGIPLTLPSASERFEGAPKIFENQLLRYKQAAQFLGISVPYLRRLKSHGLVPWVQVGARAVRFCPQSLSQWVREREIRK